MVGREKASGTEVQVRTSAQKLGRQRGQATWRGPPSPVVSGLSLVPVPDPREDSVLGHRWLDTLPLEGLILGDAVESNVTL